MSAEIVLPLRDAGMDVAFDDLERSLEPVLAAGPRMLVLDMAAVDRASSTTVAMLLWARRRCAARGVDVVVRNPSRRLKETLDRAGLTRVMAVEGVVGPYDGPPADRRGSDRRGGPVR